MPCTELSYTGKRRTSARVPTTVLHHVRLSSPVVDEYV